jgi:hypothetical protein
MGVAALGVTRSDGFQHPDRGQRLVIMSFDRSRAEARGSSDDFRVGACTCLRGLHDQSRH